MKTELLFPTRLRPYLKDLEVIEGVEEIRIRAGQPFFLYTQKEELVLTKDAGFCSSDICRKKETNKENIYYITEADIMEMQNYISNYSLYAWQEEIKNGYLTIRGGHRIGLCGSVKINNGRIDGISYITCLNIRVAHEQIGCAKQAMKYIRRNNSDIYNTLLVSAPGKGKTTLLRDCIRTLSYGEEGFSGKKVGVIDERAEIAACYHGVPQNDIGPRTDVLDGGNKTDGIRMLLRSMAPEVLAVDELGNADDFLAVAEAGYCGCRVIGTIHAGNVKELQERPLIREWSRKQIFERFVVIEKEENGKRCFRVYDNQWEQLL